MTYKEINAAIMVISAVLVSLWVLVFVTTIPDQTLATLATSLCWAILASIVINIVAAIAVSILTSVMQRRALKDERADERDWAIQAKAMRNAYFVASLSGLAALIVWATGNDIPTGIYVLFFGLMLAGAADAGSRLVYYRIG